MRHLARRAYLIILIVIATINQWHCYFISEAGRRCWIHWMHVIQDIQLCATIDRFRSGRRKEKRERKTIEHCDRPHNSNQAIPFLHYYFRMLFKWNKTNNKMLQFKNQYKSRREKLFGQCSARETGFVFNQNNFQNISIPISLSSKSSDQIA